MSVGPMILREEGLLFHSMYDAIMMPSGGTVPGWSPPRWREGA